MVTINDELVKMFLNKKISFVKMQKSLTNLIKNHNFTKYYYKHPKNINDINLMADKVKEYLKNNDKIFK